MKGDVITVVIAAYGAIVSTVLGCLTIYRDRYRLKIRVEWIARPSPGLTVRCVNTGTRPVSVEAVMFASHDGWPSRWWAWQGVPRGEVIGWLGRDYPNPPSPATPLPAYLELARDAAVHFSLDEKFKNAAGVVVRDGFGRFHWYKFKTIDRVGLAQVLAANSMTEVMSAAELRLLASNMDAGEDWRDAREAVQKLADEAEARGVSFELVVGPTGAGSAGFLQARAVPPGSKPTRISPLSEEATWVQLQRPPFPIIAVGVPALAGIACLAATILVLGLVAIPLILGAIVLAIALARRKVRRSYERLREQSGEGTRDHSR